ncbi:MAG: hypothetical protein K2L51_02055, partial [Clostridiales bacterium]|nr:hypothetical protein [Clostridiales bacterium]
MAIARMSRLRLVGLKSEKNLIMNELVKSGSFEVIPTTVAGNRPCDRTHLDKVLARQAKTAFAIEYLSACAAEYRAKKQQNDAAVKKNGAQPLPDIAVEKPARGRIAVGYDDFYDVAAKEYELTAVCDAIEKLNFTRLECKSRLQKVQARIRMLLPYAPFPLPLSRLGDGENVLVLLAHSAADTTVSFGDIPVYTERYTTNDGTLLAVVARLSDRDRATATLASAGFALCALRDDRTPAAI